MTDKMASFRDENDGQALIELMGIIVICTMIGFGIYEAGVLFHNVSVLNQAMETASLYAAQGAPVDEIRSVVYDEAENLMGGALLEQRVLRADDASSIIVEIWNPRTDRSLVTEYTPNEQKFAPRKTHIAPYLFWAQGYEIRVGVYYQIGIYVPFVKTFALTTSIVGSRTIDAPNDTDRDGMVDSQEVEYLGWWLEQQGKKWVHPVHRDGYDTMDTTDGADIDGDTAVEGIQPCGLVISRVCGGGSSSCGDNSVLGTPEHYVEIYNPGPVSYTLGEVKICDWTSGSCSPYVYSSISERLEVGEYYLLASHSVVSGGTDRIEPFELNTNSDGVVAYSAPGNRCDAVGYGSIGDGEYYEESPVSIGGTPELMRLNNADSQPIDRNANDDDFRDVDTVMNLGTGYEAYLEYDYNNDGTEDKFDVDDGSGERENLMKGNHVVGPKSWPDTVP